MFVLDYYLFVNVLRFCEKKHLFSLLLTCKRFNKITWIYLIDFLEINLNQLFTNICREGNLDSVKLLIQDHRVDPSAQDNYSIIYASNNGHLEVVKLLLQDSRVDPSAQDNYSIIRASENGYLEVVKLLLQDPRIDEEIKEIYRKKHNL